jgi:hypothetical protein
LGNGLSKCLLCVFVFLFIEKYRKRWIFFIGVVMESLPIFPFHSDWSQKYRNMNF